MATSKKRFYRIGEVSKMLNIPAYVLRYWESEFPELKPRKTVSGHRSYTEADIELIKKIAHLRYKEKLTLPGTKKRLKDDSNTPVDDRVIESLFLIKNCLQEILSDLR